MQYNFTIHGNEAQLDGNARPKLKMTGKQQWTPKAQSYKRWKEHVQAAFLSSLPREQKNLHYNCLMSNGKPILDSGNKSRMKILIYWKSKMHGDPENIFGSIADALFKQDKHLAGSFDFADGTHPAGRVEVEIKL